MLVQNFLRTEKKLLLIWRRRFRAVLSAGLLLLLTSCRRSPQAPPESVECGGVGISDDALVEILSCAGWLDFVETYVSEIEFVDAAFLEFDGQEVLGLAFCSQCKIQIPTIAQMTSGEIRQRGNVDLARLIVHEAAHLANRCQDGEEPALEAEQKFLLDYSLRSCGN